MSLAALKEATPSVSPVFEGAAKLGVFRGYPCPSSLLAVSGYSSITSPELGPNWEFRRFDPFWSFINSKPQASCYLWFLV